MSAFERAVEAELQRYADDRKARYSHFIAVATNACLYCGVTLAEVETAPIGTVPACGSQPQRELTGLQTIVASCGPFINVNADMQRADPLGEVEDES